MRVSRLEPQFVETFPTVMKPGNLYISIEYMTAGHLCACGCENEVTTPISPGQWSFTYDGQNISLCPSVGNWALACRSHYVVDRSRVRWARNFTEAEVERNRRRDRAALATGGVSDEDQSCDDDAFTDTPDSEVRPAARWRQARSRLVTLAKRWVRSAPRR